MNVLSRATEEAVEEGNAPINVADSCVKPHYRTLDTLLETEAQSRGRVKARVCFLSESNICRSLFAEAFFKQLIESEGMTEMVECESRATQNYCVGEGPDKNAAAVAEEMGVDLTKQNGAQFFEDAVDIVYFDLLLAMDKYTLADVMREVSVWDTISSSSAFTGRIRHLAEFRSGQLTGAKPKDLEDPLYGNSKGPDTLERVRSSADEIRDCCKGLMSVLVDVRDNPKEDLNNFKDQLRSYTEGLEEVQWLKPPMLTKPLKDSNAMWK